MVIEKRVQRGRETHVASVDLEKACDSVPIETLWKEMENIRVNPILIEATLNLYEKNTARKTIGSKLTK
jgi:hypothetical protein